MSAVDRLLALQTLGGLSTGDYYECEQARQVQAGLADAQAFLKSYRSATGITGPAEDTAQSWAGSIQDMMAEVQQRLDTWTKAHAIAREAMRVAANQADDIVAMIPTQAQLNVLAIQPEAISPITGQLVSGWQAAQDLKKQQTAKAEVKAQQILDIMN